jgi:repressor LexA
MNCTNVQLVTETQKNVYDFIRRHVRQHRRGVTFREIQKEFGYASTNAAQDHVRNLRGAGVLRSDLRGARSILPVTLDEGIPVFGTIPAGIPIDVAAEGVDVIDLNESLFGMKAGAPLFALRVRGQSMINAGIHDGDIVVLTTRPPRNGDIVAALVDKQSTLKRYFEERGKVLLKAEGFGFKDIHPAEELVIQGVMVGLLRRGSR